MSAKWTLSMEDMLEAFFEDSCLIGLVSALPAYRLCWLLNQRFGLSFVREGDLDICLQKSAGQQHHFSIYQYCIPLSGTRYLLYKLKDKKEVLLPEVKQLDYLWMIQSNDAEDEAATITQYLRNIPDIQMAQIITLDRLKNLNHLLV
ncbi:IPExxxVDY family protein [Chitinophagaceae bacterium MMS25-I14]